MKKTKTLEEMPEFISAEDLVSLGIYPSRAAAYQSRKFNHGPAYIKMQHKVLYQKKVIIEWIESKTVGDK